MVHQEVLMRCEDCGSFWDTSICLRTKKPVCRYCCDTDCPNHYSCWGRYY